MSISDGNGILISDQDGSIIAFESSSTEDACRGEETGLAPIIVTQPVGGTYLEGESFSISVDAIGTEPLSYQWYLNSIKIDLATEREYYVDYMNTDSMGSFHCVVANELGEAISDPALVYGVRLFSAGSNYFGEMGIGFSATYETFTANEYKNIKKIASNGNHSFMLLYNGELYFSGEQGAGEGGIGSDEYSITEWTLSATNVKDVFPGGGDTSFYIDNDYHLYFAGSNSNGESGSGIVQNEFRSWIHVADDVIFACGSTRRTSFYIDKDYHLYYSGQNAKNQAGVADTSTVFEWTSCGVAAKKVVCGWEGAMIISQDNSVWVSGECTTGAFGMGEVYNFSTWTKCSSLEGVDISDISISGDSGSEHAIALGTDGKTYVSGNNDRGQLGLGDNTNRYLFEQVSSGIKKMTCAYRFSMLLTNDEKLLMSGDNSYGSHGDGTYNTKDEFTEVASDVVDIMESSTSHTSFILKKITGVVG